MGTVIKRDKPIKPARPLARTQAPSFRKRFGIVARVALSIILVAGLSVDPNVTRLTAFAQNAVNSEVETQEASADMTIGASEADPSHGDVQHESAPEAPQTPVEESKNGTLDADSNTIDESASSKDPADGSGVLEDASGEDGSSEDAAGEGSSKDAAEEEGSSGVSTYAADDKSIRLSDTGWRSDASVYTMAFEVAATAAYTGSVVVTLPRYVTLAQGIEPSPENGIEKIEVLDPSTDPNGITTIIFTVKGAAGATGLDFRVSQAGFIDNARINSTRFTYVVEAKWLADDGASLAATSKTYDPRVKANQLTGSFTVQPQERVNLINSTDYKVYANISGEVNLDDTTPNLFGSIRIPKSYLALFEVDPGVQYDSNGDLLVPYSLGDTSGSTPYLSKELPLKVDKNEVWTYLSGSPDVTDLAIPLQMTCERSDGTKVAATGRIAVDFPILGWGSYYQTYFGSATTLNQNSLSSDDNGVFTFPNSDLDFRVWIPNAPSNQGSSSSGNGAVDPSTLSNLSVSFVVPAELEWAGDANYYDAVNRRVTVNLVVGDALDTQGLYGYKLNLASGSEIKFKPKEGDNYFPKSFKLSAFAFSGSMNGVHFENPEKYTLKDLTVNFENVSTGIDFTSGQYSVVEGSQDSTLYSLKRASRQNVNYFPVSFAASIDPEFFAVDKVEVDTTQLARVTDGKAVEFVYTTKNGANGKSDLSSDVVLSAGDCITSWELRFVEGLSGKVADTFLTFKGTPQQVSEEYKTVHTQLSVKDLRFDSKHPYMVEPETETRVARHIIVKDPISSISGGPFRYSTTKEIAIKLRAATNAEIVSTGGRITFDLKLPENIKLTSMRSRDNGFAGPIVTYTTKENGTPQEKRLSGRPADTILLRGDDYFTSISVDMPFETYQSEVLYLGGMIKDEYVMTNDEELDYVTAQVGESFSVNAQEVTAPLQMLKRGSVKVGTNTNSSTSWQLGNRNPQVGTTFSAKGVVSYRSMTEGLTAEKESSLTLDNPTFYVSMPRWVSYVEGSFKIDGFEGKKPTVTRIPGPDSNTSYLKVEYAGPADGESGIAFALNSSPVLSMELKVEEFAKRGEQRLDLNVYTDFSKTWDALDKKGVDASYAVGQVNSTNFVSSTSTLQDINRRVLVLNKPGYAFVNVLQLTNTVFSLTAVSSSDASPAQSTKVVSGEDFSVFIDIVNNASAMEGYVMYIPIPRKGIDIGKGEPEWTAHLTDVVVGSGTGVNLEYSTNANPTMNQFNNAPGTGGAYDPVGMYVLRNQVADMTKVTMVKVSISSIQTNGMVSLQLKMKSAGDKTRVGELANRFSGAYSATRQGSVWSSAWTNDCIVRLADTNVSGRLWVDDNGDGRIDGTEGSYPDGHVVLHAVDGTVVEETNSDADGLYSFTVLALPQGAYLTVDKPSHYMLTHQGSSSDDKTTISSFNPDTYRAELTPIDTKNVNAGFVFVQDLSFVPDAYTVRANRDVQLVWNLDPSDPPRALTFSSSNEQVATVDASGKVNGIAPGTVEIEGSFENELGFTIKAKATVTVETNDAPVIATPAAVELNKGDAWDPRDTAIVPGLAVSDDHDNLQLSDLSVAGESFAKDGKANAVGTYEVTYAVKDSDGNESTATVKVKVHGLPYLTDKEGNAFPGGTPPMLYVRFDDGVDPFGKVRAFWEEASDTVGEPAQKREIVVTDASTGTFKLDNTSYENGMPTPAITGAGAYKGDYYMLTPKGGSASVQQKMHVRGKLNLFANSISVPATAPKTHFDTFSEFVQVYGGKLGIASDIEVTDAVTGQVSTLDLTDKVDVKGTMADYDFSLPAGQTSKSVHLTLTVTDATSDATYGTKIKEFDIDVTVLDAVGNAPTIKFDKLENPLERIASDTVQEDPVEGSPALLDSELYGKLLRDASIEDVEGPVASSSIESARVLQGDMTMIIDMSDGASIRRMLTTPGTYELSYKAVDSDGNTVTADREIRVAGATVFVTNLDVSAEAPAPSILNFRQRVSGMYSPAGTVMAYHIDADGSTRHQEPVTSAGNRSADLRQVGATVLTAQSRHHYWFWPATTLDRPLDEFQQTVLVHGPIQFAGDTGDVEAFVDESVDVSNVTASFQRAVDTSAGTSATTVTESLVVSKDKADQMSAAQASTDLVTYRAHDNVSGSDAGNDATLERTVRFYGLPEVFAPAKVIVPEYADKDSYHKSILDAINASATVALPDGTKETLPTAVDFTTNLGAQGGKVTVSATYEIANGTKSRTASADVEVVVSKRPVVTASDIELNVGDTLDVIGQSGASVTDDLDALTASDLKVESSVPVDGSSKVTTAGTTAVRIFTTDTQGNVGEVTVNVRVNGLPVIDGAPDVIARVGDSLTVWDDITVSWEQAPSTPGPAQKVSFKHGDDPSLGTVELTNYRKVEGSTETPVDASALNNPGLYLGDYVATIPTGTSSTETRTLMLHGKPVVTASSITLGVNEPAITNTADFLAKYGTELGISATTVHVNSDGATAAVDLLAEGKVDLDLSKIGFGVKGVYELVVNVQDEAPGADARTYSTTVDVTIDDFRGTPPHIITHTVQRVSTDAIMNAAGQSLGDYLLTDRFAKVEKRDHEVSTFEVDSIEKISGPSFGDASNNIAADAPESVDPKNEDQLAKMFSTVGSYRITYVAVDDASNRVSALATLDVAGPTEFGTMIDGGFVALGDTVQARQAAGEDWTPSAIRARHQDMDGSYHYVPLDPTVFAPDGTSLEEAKALDVAVSAVHHRDVYEDGSSRPHDERPFKLLVQGLPEIAGLDRPLVLYQGDTLNVLDGVTATFKHVDAKGVVTEQQADLSVITEPSNDVPGTYRALVRAADTVTGAPDGMVEGDRSIEVNGTPRLEYASSVSVPVNASLDDVKKALGVIASYKSAAGTVEDITDAIVMDASSLDLSQGGASFELDLAVPYTLDPPDAQRTVPGRANVYVDAAPTLTSVNDDFNKGDAFDPMDGVAFDDLEDGSLDGAAVSVVENTVDATAAGTYHVVYSVKDTGGNMVELERVVRVHGLPVIVGAPANLSTRVGSLPAEPMTGVTASFLKAAENVGDDPVETTIQAVDSGSALRSLFSAPRLAGLTFGMMRDANGNSVDRLENPGLYYGTYEAVSPYGGTAQVDTALLVHGLPGVTSTGLEIQQDDPAGMDVSRLVAEAGLKAMVEHVRPDGTVVQDVLPDEALAIAHSDVDVSKPGTYTVRVSAVDSTAPAAFAEADVQVTVRATPVVPDPVDPSNPTEPGDSGDSQSPAEAPAPTRDEIKPLPKYAALTSTGDGAPLAPIAGIAIAAAVLALVALSIRRARRRSR